MSDEPRKGRWVFDRTLGFTVFKDEENVTAEDLRATAERMQQLREATAQPSKREQKLRAAADEAEAEAERLRQSLEADDA